MHQSKNNPHILQEISTNILTKMSDITGSPHWACSEKCKQKKLVTENSVSAVWSGYYVFTLFFQTRGDTDSDLVITVNDEVLCAGDGANDYKSGSCSAVVQFGGRRCCECQSCCRWCCSAHWWRRTSPGLQWISLLSFVKAEKPQ